MKNNIIAQVDKAYSKRVSLLNKNFITDSTTGLAIFVEQLKYIRDKLLIDSATQLADPFKDTDVDEKLALLILAISEFEAYIESDNSQKTFHWNNFWEFIKLNAEGWLIPNDTI